MREGKRVRPAWARRGRVGRWTGRSSKLTGGASPWVRHSTVTIRPWRSPSLRTTRPVISSPRRRRIRLHESARHVWILGRPGQAADPHESIALPTRSRMPGRSSPSALVDSGSGSGSGSGSALQRGLGAPRQAGARTPGLGRAGASEEALRQSAAVPAPPLLAGDGVDQLGAPQQAVAGHLPLRRQLVQIRERPFLEAGSCWARRPCRPLGRLGATPTPAASKPAHAATRRTPAGTPSRP